MMSGLAVAAEVSTSWRAAAPPVSVHSTSPFGADQHDLLDRPGQQRRLPHRLDVGRPAGIDAARGQVLERRDGLPELDFGRAQRPRRGDRHLVVALLASARR